MRTDKYEQPELPMMGGMLKGEPRYLNRELIEACDTKEDAIRLCWVMRRDKSLTITEAAKRLGLSRPQLSKILDGYSGMRGNQERALQYLAGNLAIAQYMAWDVGCQLVEEIWAARQARAA